MEKLLVIVDMQNDFIDGALGTKEAVAIVPNVADKISNWDGDIAFTMDTHRENYLETSEGKKLPVPHCIKYEHGWELNDSIRAAIDSYEKVSPVFMKKTFGSFELANYIEANQYEYIEFVGLCTDICVISNVMLTKAAIPEATIVVDASCCAGVTPESHTNALSVMRMCQIDVINAEV